MSSSSEPIRTLDLAAAAVLTETPDLEGAYPRFDQAQLEILGTSGERRPIQPAKILFVEGDPSESFYVVLTGRVAMVEAYGTPEQRVVRVHGHGRFLGELSLLTGETEFSTAVALEAGEMLVVPVTRIRALVAQDPVLGDEILRACLVRRTLAIGLGLAFGLSARGTHPTHTVCVISRCATGCHTASLTWKTTRLRRTCYANCSSKSRTPQ